MNKRTTRIISAFPGTGKSWLVANGDIAPRIIDLDSAEFTLGYDVSGKVNNTNFPENYLRAIEKQIGLVDILLVSIHQEVRDMLLEKGAEFTLIYPDRDLKAEYNERFHQRRNPEHFINLFIDNWDAILDQLVSQKGCDHIVLNSNEYLSEVINPSITI